MGRDGEWAGLRRTLGWPAWPEEPVLTGPAGRAHYDDDSHLAACSSRTGPGAYPV